MAKDDRLTIRGINPALWKDARVEAIEEGITIGKFVNRALADYVTRMRCLRKMEEKGKGN